MTNLIRQFFRTADTALRLAEDGGSEEAGGTLTDFLRSYASGSGGNAGEQLVDLFMEGIRKLALNIAVSLVILFIGVKVIKMVLKVTDKALNKAGVETGTIQFLRSVLRVILYVLLFVMIAAQLGVNTTSVFTLLGTAGLAIAMSLQGSLSNVAGGILILLMRPFKVGDFISTSHGDGTVREIGMVYTSITTPDNRVITIPNGDLSNSAVTNVTANPVRRLDLTVSIDYGADIRKAREVILELLHSHPDVEKDREMLVFVDSLGESAVNLGVLCWVKTPQFLTAKRALNEEIKCCLDEAGVKIPFPQLDVHLDR